MTHAHTPLTLRATTAIIAVLALGTTPVLAQEAAPQVDLPAASAAAPPPTIVLPTRAPAPPAPAPVTLQAPTPTITLPAQTAEPAVASPATATARTNASRTRPATRNAATSSAATPARTAAAPAAAAAASTPESAPLSASAPVSVPAAPVIVPIAAPANEPMAVSPTPEVADNDATLGAGALAALLLALGIGGGALIAARSRRRRRWVAYQAAHTPAEATAVPGSQAPVAATVAASGDLTPAIPLPVYATVDDATFETPPAYSAPEPAVSTEGPIPQTRAERDALLERMASAAPDEANPFTSPKGRMRRARLILQAREYDHKDEAGQPFDWRTYRPTARHLAPATPERVTV
jgi:hypothetical protein